MADSYDSHFTSANIPFGIASRLGVSGRAQIATRLHDRVYFLPELSSRGLLRGLSEELERVIQEPLLNGLASLGRPAPRQLRSALQYIFRSANTDSVRSCSAPAVEVEMHLPVRVGDFSDFSCSKDHVLNAGEAATGVRSLPPGFPHFPIGYGGRSSSIVPSGTKIRRPLGQFRSGDSVEFGACKAMDYELEVGSSLVVPLSSANPSRLTTPRSTFLDLCCSTIGVVRTPIKTGPELADRVTARDIQMLEMAPLGPFNGKSVGTTISPWIVTLDALEPFRVAGYSHF